MPISEPAATPVLKPSVRAFLELGFRPLYLAGCAWAAVSVALWVFAPQWLAGALGGVAWHAHEMLWGFVATIAVGFLLTAASNWTGINPAHGAALGGLCVLWITARAVFLVPGPGAFAFAALCDVAFFAVAAVALARAIYSARSQRNYGVPLLVLALAIADALYLSAAWRGDHALLLERFNTGLMCMALIALLIARRVIPFFAMRAVPGLAIPMHTASGHWQLAAVGVAAACALAGWRPGIAAGLAIAGAIVLLQLLAWKPAAVRHIPLLWILYLGYAGLGLGLFVAAAHAQGWLLRSAWPAHAIGMGGFAVLIIGMVTRTALGHLGRPLQTDGSMVAAYLLVCVATVLRLIALVPSSFTLTALHVSTTAWVLAFALYLWRFVPMLIRPRHATPPPAVVLRPSPPLR